MDLIDSCIVFTWRCVWAEPGWADPGSLAGCGFPSQWLMDIWATG